MCIFFASAKLKIVASFVRSLPQVETQAAISAARNNANTVQVAAACIQLIAK